MPEPPRRQRRETAEAPVGIGGLSPHPARGPITALRVYGRGSEIAISANRAERLGRIAGERVTVRGEPAIALDEPTRRLVEPLTAYCGLGALGDVDAALEAVLWRHPIILRGARAEDVVELARTIHEHSIRKGFPFLQVSSVPTTDAAIEALCTQAGAERSSSTSRGRSSCRKHSFVTCSRNTSISGRSRWRPPWRMLVAALDQE